MSAPSLQPLNRCAFSICVSRQKGGQEAQTPLASQTVLEPASSAALSEDHLIDLREKRKKIIEKQQGL